MGKLKIVAEAPDPQLTLSINLERPEATYTAGEVVSGSIQCHATHPFDCDGIVVTLHGKEEVTGIEKRPFQWEHTLLETKVAATKTSSMHATLQGNRNFSLRLYQAQISLDRGQDETFSAGSESIPFSVELDATLASTYSFESAAIGPRTEITLYRVYTISVVFSLRNSTKVEAIVPIVVNPNTDIVWPGSLPSASLEDSIAQPVNSALSNCLCWRRRGETLVVATIHNRTVDIATGVVHVRCFIVNRSAVTVNAARLCLLVDTALHAEKSDRDEDEDEGDEEENAPVHAIELLSATDYCVTKIPPGGSTHLNLELDVQRVALGLLSDQGAVLEPSIRTQFLEIGYIVRVEVCHANGGSTISLDLPLVLVPQPSDILPPFETLPLVPIRGRDSQASTEHEDIDLDTKSQHDSSRVSSLEHRPPEAVSDTPALPSNLQDNADTLPPASGPPGTKISQREVQIHVRQDA